MPPFTWHDQQLAIFDHGERNLGSLNVIARAGTGKTTTLVELARRVKGRVFLGAFNKSIADELAARVQSNPRCTASTFHSIGFKLWKEIRCRAQVDNRKVPTLARELYPWDKKVRELIVDAVGFAKLDGLGLNGMPEYSDVAAWREMFDEHDMWDDVPAGISEGRVLDDCIKVFKKSLDMCESQANSVIDFNDMLYAPLYFGSWKPQRFDWVMMDEAQDTNETRLRLAQSILVTGGSFVAVGDPAQAIYQFAGAKLGAMDHIKDSTGAKELPLTMTYRCPKLVVAMAQEHVPDYTAAEGNGTGVIESTDYRGLWQLANTLTPKDVILCRNTRPLVGIAKRLRADHGIPCIVEGNTGKAILSLLSKWGDDMTWGQYTTRLDQYKTLAVGKLLGKVSNDLEDYDDTDLTIEQKLARSKKEEQADYIMDKVKTIYDIADDPMPDTPLKDVIARAERLFGKGQENSDILRLCTGHRCKGREWDRVICIGNNRYIPSYFAKTDEDKQAEANVEYVMITRTKRVLVLVSVPVPGKDGYPVKEEMDWWEL